MDNAPSEIHEGSFRKRGEVIPGCELGQAYEMIRRAVWRGKIPNSSFLFVKKITVFVQDNIQKTMKENGHNWESMI